MMSPLCPIGPTEPSRPNPELQKAAEAFEAVILRQLLGTMRQAKLADEMFGSNATTQFREMADAHTADAMAQMHAFGIADMVERQLAAAKGQGG